MKRLAGYILTLIFHVFRKPPEIYRIDSDADPFVPLYWEVVEHRKMGIVTIERRKDGLYVNNKRVGLYRSKGQLNGRDITGHSLREEVSGENVLNANILSFLLRHPKLIPEEEWGCNERGGDRKVFFWGTVYKDPYGDLHIYGLHRVVPQVWDSDVKWITSTDELGFAGCWACNVVDRPAAVLEG